MDRTSLFYSVRSDGTGLQLASEAFSILPAEDVRLEGVSPHGTSVAYLILHENASDLVLAKVDGSQTTRFPAVISRNARNFDFVGEECVVLYERDNSNPLNQVTLKRLCLGENEPQAMETIEFPSQIPPENNPRRFYRISPQGDKLLNYEYALNENGSLYVKTLSDAEPSRLIFQSPNRSCTSYWYQWHGRFQWSPDGKTVDLLWTSLCDGQAENIFYQLDLQDLSVKTRVMIPNLVVNAGTWSPDNREFVFWYSPVEGGSVTTPDWTISSLYRLSLETGAWAKIVPEFYAEGPMFARPIAQ